MTVRICPIQKRIEKKNPISGHEWAEYGPVTGYRVVGPLGTWSTHKSEQAAVKEAMELTEHYLKYPINYGG